jgi:hypothetical protein
MPTFQLLARYYAREDVVLLAVCNQVPFGRVAAEEWEAAAACYLVCHTCNSMSVAVRMHMWLRVHKGTCILMYKYTNMRLSFVQY